MREKLKALADLQKVDLEIASLRKSADIYPKQIAELEKELGVARSGVETERARHLEVEKQKRALEQNIVDEKDKVKKWEQRLAEQRSTREYAALAREIDIAKKSNQTMAEENIELGKSVTQAKDAVKVKEGELAARTDQLAGRMAELREKAAGSQGAIKELETKRTEAATHVDKTLLHRYETVRKKRMPVMVAVLAPGTCQGCNMNVPPQLYNNLRSSLGTDVCPSCHRIIYAAEALEAPPSK
ncbi:MAG: zinc ribbon domain-containing protein [Myxococcaceae bacterium]